VNPSLQSPCGLCVEFGLQGANVVGHLEGFGDQCEVTCSNDGSPTCTFPTLTLDAKKPSLAAERALCFRVFKKWKICIRFGRA
jgi:hypothetical protein